MRRYGDPGLQELLTTGALLGAARDGGYQIAWAYGTGTRGDPSSGFGITVLNLDTGKRSDYPGPYLKTSVNPKAGVPLLFSPDGGALAFADRTGDGARLTTLDLQTGRPSALIQGEWYPVAWGESGRSRNLVFEMTERTTFLGSGAWCVLHC